MTRSNRRFTASAVALFAAATFTLAGCGGDDGVDIKDGGSGSGSASQPGGSPSK